MEKGEYIKKGNQKVASPIMTLQKAVDMGEYNPEYLSTFPEWNTLTRYVQFQFIKQGLDNRRKMLWIQWSEIVNTPDFSRKPHLSQALKNIESAIKKLDEDWEVLYLEYSK
jgi:hypothetical protein